LDAKKVVGFSWGYPITPEDLEVKVGIQLREEVTRRFGPQTKVGYQDEIGVLPAYRGTKLAKTMNKMRVSSFMEKGLHVVVSRARQYPEPSVTFSWYTKKLGYEILAAYPREDGRVMLTRKLEGLVEAYK
jgi:hypothetical protein